MLPTTGFYYAIEIPADHTPSDLRVHVHPVFNPDASCSYISEVWKTSRNSNPAQYFTMRFYQPSLTIFPAECSSDDNRVDRHTSGMTPDSSMSAMMSDDCPTGEMLSCC